MPQVAEEENISKNTIYTWVSKARKKMGPHDTGKNHLRDIYPIGASASLIGQITDKVIRSSKIAVSTAGWSLPGSVL